LYLGAVVFSTLKDFKAYKEASRISIFLSMPTGEIQTDAIVRHAIQSGKQVFVPYLYKNPSPSADVPSRVMDMVRLESLRDYESLQPDKWGIPSIDPATVHERERILGGSPVHGGEGAVLDLILMPGVAFDLHPHDGWVRRLGHGRGFYDYFINRYREQQAPMRVGEEQRDSASEPGRPPLLLCGLALSEQFLTTSSDGEIPVGPLDQPLDNVILGNGVIKGRPLGDRTTE